MKIMTSVKRIKKAAKYISKHNPYNKSYEEVLKDWELAEKMRKENVNKSPQEILWQVYKEKNPNAIKSFQDNQNNLKVDDSQFQPSISNKYQEDPNFDPTSPDNLIQPVMTDEEFDTYMKIKGLPTNNLNNRLDLNKILKKENKLGRK